MGLFKEKTRSWAIYNMKCPRCRIGYLFHTTTFSFQRPFDMPKRCSHCDQKYFPEPGFYYGAMFISYILTAFLFLIIMGFQLLILKMEIYHAFGILFLICAIFYVWFFRISRTLWIHFRVRYNSKYDSQK